MAGRKPKVPDEQLAEVLRDGRYTSYYAVANAVNITPSENFTERCQRLEKKLGIPHKERRGQRRINIDKLPEADVEPPESLRKTEPEVPTAKAVPVRAERTVPVNATHTEVTPFRFRPKEPVCFDGYQRVVDAVLPEKIAMRRNCDMRYITLTAEEYIENPGILRQSEEKPRITTVGEAVVLRQRDEAKEYIQDTETVETAKKFEPFDLEMGDNTDTVKEFGPLFEDVDYIDDAWGTVEKPTVASRFKGFIAKLRGEGKK